MTEEEKEVKSTKGGSEGSVLGEAEEGAAEAISPPEEAKKVELTEEELAALKKKAEERDEYWDLLLRTRADFSNYQKRMRRELEAMGRYGAQELVKALIPAMDHLSRAIKSARESATEKNTNSAENLKKFLDGLQLIQNEFLKALEGAGVRNIEVEVGRPFNPEFHEAFLEEENLQLPHHTVLELLEPGFILHDRVLKPAKVKVSRRPTLPEEPSTKGKADSPQLGQEGSEAKEKEKT